MNQDSRRFLVPILAVLFAGCGGFSATGGPAPLVSDPLVVKVSPGFRASAMHSVVVVPLEGPVGRPLSVEEREQVTALVLQVLDAETGFEVLNVTEPSETTASISKFGSQGAPLANRALEISRGAKAQGALYGIVSQMQPGAVSFHLWLIESNSGATVWEAGYNLGDRTLSENLFRLPQVVQGGAVQYRASDELLKKGFVEAAKALESARRTS